MTVITVLTIRKWNLLITIGFCGVKSIHIPVGKVSLELSSVIGIVARDVSSSSDQASQIFYKVTYNDSMAVD